MDIWKPISTLNKKNFALLNRNIAGGSKDEKYAILSHPQQEWKGKCTIFCFFFEKVVVCNVGLVFLKLQNL